MEQYGIDISERRLDDLDKQILHFALNYRAGDKVAIDLGCGFGRVSVMLALIGFEVWLFDTRDLDGHFKRVAKDLELEGKLNFFKKDIAKITKNDLQRRAGIVVAQRVLHHLPFASAKQVVEIVTDQLGKEGRVFASFSGLNSEIGKDYQHAQNIIEKRFSKVSADNQEKFKISEEVCLYESSGVEKLFANTGLLKERLYRSSFGNIKAVYYNKNKKTYKLKKLLWKFLH